MKKKNVAIIAFVWCLTLIIGCNKKGVGCFNDGGKVISVQLGTHSFTKIDVSTNVDIEILTEGSDLIELTIGENLVAGISVGVEEGVLKIKNLNTCFFARDYIKPLIKIRNSNLVQIVQHGYGRIYSTDTLHISDLSIQVEDASGEVDLILDAKKISVVTNNIGPIYLRGKTDNLVVGQYWSDGIFYGKELKAKRCKVNHNGSNRMEFNVLGSFTGSINSIGNVHLYGQEPLAVSVDITNQGRVFKEY